MKKLKILLATSTFHHKGGGIASYNQELMKALGSIHDIYLLTQARESDVEGFVETISTCGKKTFGYKYSSHILNYINSHQFDIIINSNNRLLSILAPFINAPIVTIAHFYRGIMADEAGYNGEYISKAIVLSKSCQSYLIDKFALPKDKIEVVYNFVAPTTHPYSDKKEKDKLLTIVYPGGASIAKSSDIVIDAVYKLLKTNLSFKFIWIGRTLTYASYLSLLGLKKIEDFFDNEDRIEIKGKVSRDESEKIIASSNIFLLPSRGEGCPMSLLEAMREGCIPVISDANHGSLDIIHDCKAGVVVEQDNSEALFQALKHIIENHEQYISNYKSTYNYSLDVLSRSLWLMKMQGIFADVLNERKKMLKFNRRNYIVSIIPFMWLIFKDKLNQRSSVIKYRFNVELIYLRSLAKK